MTRRRLSTVLFSYLLALLATGGAFAYPRKTVSDAEFLELCASGTAQEIVDALNSGANVQARDAESMTGLMYAVEKNPNSAVIPILLDAGMSVNARGGHNMTALMVAARSNRNPGIIALLLNAGANIEARDENGMTVLMFAAAMNNNPVVIATLVEAGADVNAQDEGGRMAVGYARDNGNLASFEIALRRRRDTQMIDVLISSAERGDADSQYQLGLMYARGEGVEEDQWKAVQWFRKAVRQRYEPARHELVKRGLDH